jgi:hypothetical protein
MGDIVFSISGVWEICDFGAGRFHLYILLQAFKPW